MEIYIQDRNLAKEYNNERALRKRYGNRRATLIQRRLAQLEAATTLEDMRFLPGRCHALTRNRQEQLAVDLDGPYRLIFEPANDPLPLRIDGGLDWTRVTAILILEVVNYHD